MVAMRVVSYNGFGVVLSEERWHHIVLRHPEMKEKSALILNAISNPNEVYLDLSGAVHSLKRLVGGLSDFLVVIYSRSGEEGYIRTAYYTSSRRKTRRYRQFRKPKVF
jgi:hypothetical protein